MDQPGVGIPLRALLEPVVSSGMESSTNHETVVRDLARAEQQLQRAWPVSHHARMSFESEYG